MGLVQSSLGFIIHRILASLVDLVWPNESSSKAYDSRGHHKMTNAPEYAVGWGSLALINAGLAQGKTRSGLNWFLLSLLLGPVATFILVAFCDELPDKK